MALFVLSIAESNPTGWTPTFHDNDPLDWLVTFGYLAAAGLCIYAWWKERDARLRSTTPRFWIVIGVLMGALAVNKQLNFQTLLGQLGRQAVEDEGLYRSRRTLQKVFVVAFCGIGISAWIAMILWVRHTWRRYALALSGLALAGLYAVVRAATFNHVLREPSGARHHPLTQESLEVLAVTLVSVGAGWAVRSCRRPKLKAFERTVRIR